MPDLQPGINNGQPVIIVGAGHSGVAVAAGLRTRGWVGGILLLDGEKETPYERPPLSKELLKSGAPDESTVLRKEKFYQDKRIERLAGITAEAIDRQSRTVVLSDGSRRGYDRLVVATGSRARPSPFPAPDSRASTPCGPVKTLSTSNALSSPARGSPSSALVT